LFSWQKRGGGAPRGCRHETETGKKGKENHFLRAGGNNSIHIIIPECRKGGGTKGVQVWWAGYRKGRGLCYMGGGVGNSDRPIFLPLKNKGKAIGRGTVKKWKGKRKNQKGPSEERRERRGQEVS